MDGGLRRMCSSVKWCALYLHTHKLHSGMCCVWWASYEGKAFNLTVPKWMQQCIFKLKTTRHSSFPAMAGDLTCSTSQTSTLAPSQLSRGGTQDTNSLMCNRKAAATTLFVCACSEAVSGSLSQGQTQLALVCVEGKHYISASILYVVLLW